MITGLYPDPPDERDLLLRRVIRSGPVADTMDYRATLQTVRNQGSEGTCAAFAGAGMKESQECGDCGLTDYLSPRYLYHYAKKYDGLGGLEGTTLRAVMEALYKHGICLEDTWPYLPPGKKPTGADKEAGDFRIETYAKLTTLLDMEKCLTIQGPFLIGLDVWQGWMEAGETIPDPPRRYDSLGGHAVLVCGFDSHKKQLLLRNSWGPCWGEQGYSWISYYHIQRCYISAWSSVDLAGSKLTKGAKK